MLIEINGDILNFSVKYIAHQCNCKTRKFSGVAKSIFDKYPYANTYIDGSIRIPGNICVRGNGKDKRFVINMYAQLNPGKQVDYYFVPDGNLIDTENDRLKWMIECLQKVSKIENLESIAFPYKMGCSLGGGDWEKYKKILNKFAEKNPNIKVFVIKKC